MSSTTHPSGLVVIVTGSRDLRDYGRVYKALNRLRQSHGLSLVVEGGNPKGADAAARRWCEYHGVENVTYEADWDAYGKAAGHVRNGVMLDAHPTAIVLGFPAPHGKGTQDCMKKARARGMRVIEFEWRG